MQAPASTRLSFPTPTDRFVGRASDLTTLEKLFADGNRLVTVWATAGMGKTRIALELAARRRAEGRPAVFCALAGAQDRDGLLSEIARGLDVPLSQDRTAKDSVHRLASAIAARGRVLLVLDNFEHLVEHVAVVSQLLRGTRQAELLVTSRERLRVQGETAFELLPLGTGNREGAEELFVERVRASQPNWDPSEAQRDRITRLVRSFEGIPLVIELAAARVPMLGLEGLEAKLPEYLDVLALGRRDVDARQATLRGAIAWSWNLLSLAERMALAQASVFRGGFSLDAAEQVLGGGMPGQTSVLDLVSQLRDRSLLRTYFPDEQPDLARCMLFEPIRAFAADKLIELGEAAAAEARHTAYFRRAANEWSGADDGAVQFSLDVHNLLVVVERALAVQPPTVASTMCAVEIIVAMEPILASRASATRQLVLVDRATKALDHAPIEPAARARILRIRGRAAQVAGKLADAERDFEAALVAAKDDRELTVTLLVDLGVVHHRAQRFDRARQLYEEATNATDDLRSKARALGNLGALAHDEGSFELARTRYEEAITRLRQVEDARLEGTFLGNLGVLEQELGLLGPAKEHGERALVLLRSVGDARLEAITLGNLGMLHHERGDLDLARASHETALSKLREIGDTRSEALCLTRLGAVLAASTHTESGAAKLDAAERLCASLKDPVGLGTVALARAFVELSRFLGARSVGHEEEERASLDAVKPRMEEARAGLAKHSDDVRTFLRILERARERLHAGDVPETELDDAALVLGPEGRWVRPPRGAWQDLRTKKAARLILVALAEDHRGGSAGLTVRELYEAAWGGDKSGAEAGANRVHVTLAALRKMGLKAFILLREDAYALDPALRVQRIVSDWPIVGKS